MWHILLNIGLGLLSAAWPVLIAWGVIYANKVDERHWVAEQRALQARRKAARLRALDEWEQARARRSAEWGTSDDHDPLEEEPASGHKLAGQKEPPSEDGGVNA